ncbi:MAG: glycosyltransferase family 2 protein [Oscillatoriales cyanobacterium]|nr:MAG: glycosyltransferase family 2 protein [Oscillatoriales cyanobacterium]
MQRYVGLLNARGRYIICIDDDDYMHPDLPLAAEHYFQRFPESWLLRLHKELIPSNEPSSFIAPWNPIPDILNLTVVERSDSLRSIPIAPLRNHFKLRYLIQPYRKTGWFMENFNNTVWRTDIVQQALPRIAKVMTICGNLKLIPNSGCERFFGLFIQAFAYRPSLTIGHLLPETAPIRFSKVDPALKKPRFHIFVDFLLFRAFPSYDYFWSLFSAQLIYGTPRTLLKSLRWTLWPPKKK